MYGAPWQKSIIIAPDDYLFNRTTVVVLLQCTRLGVVWHLSIGTSRGLAWHPFAFGRLKYSYLGRPLEQRAG